VERFVARVFGSGKVTIPVPVRELLGFGIGIIKDANRGSSRSCKTIKDTLEDHHRSK